MPASRGPIYYGGQAVIEGVMIRGPREMAVAVRAPDGEIVVRSEQLSGIYAGRVRRIPLLRGVVVLYETLALGVRALTWSSQVASGRASGEVSGAQMAVTLAVTAPAPSQRNVRRNMENVLAALDGARGAAQ